MTRYITVLLVVMLSGTAMGNLKDTVLNRLIATEVEFEKTHLDAKRLRTELGTDHFLYGIVDLLVDRSESRLEGLRDTIENVDGTSASFIDDNRTYYSLLASLYESMLQELARNFQSYMLAVRVDLIFDELLSQSKPTNNTEEARGLSEIVDRLHKSSVNTLR